MPEPPHLELVVKNKPLLIALLAGLAVCGTTHAALLGRDFDTSTAGYEAFYDDQLNITWLADANLAASNTFGVSGINSDGTMLRDVAFLWIAAMNAAKYLGYDDWRLPELSPINGSSFDYNISDAGNTDRGNNISAPGTAYVGSTASELAYMYFSNLDNKSSLDITGQPQTGFGLVDDPSNPNDETLFSGIQPYPYWFGTEYAVGSNNGWAFHMGLGFQSEQVKLDALDVWAVRDGDVAAVPEPTTLLLLGLGIVGLGAMRRRYR